MEKFDADREAVIERALQAGIEHIVIPGLTIPSSKAIVDMVRLASPRPSLHAAVGVHPTEARTWDETSKEDLRSLIAKDRGKICAIGEIGLDFYWETAPPELQKLVLREQLVLAAELGLPVILHMREAKDSLDGPCAQELLHILEEWTSALKAINSPLVERPGVLHSFSGSLETAHRAIELGFYIGVTGPVTNPNALIRQEIVAALPLERLLTETDSPFLAPHPHRGKRNEPAYVRLIADKIALLHSSTPNNVAGISSQNAARLFQWM